MTDRFNSANLEVKREPDMQGVGSNSPSSANVQVKNERLNGYPDDGGKFFNKITKKWGFYSADTNAFVTSSNSLNFEFEIL